MSGNVKLIIQEENGEISVFFPNKTYLSELIIHNDLNSEDPKIRNKRCEEIKKKCLEDQEELKKESDNLSISLLKECKYKTPDWYGLCFISFKDMILLNIQDGSSITTVTNSKYMSVPYKMEAIKNFKIKYSDEENLIFHLKYHPQWLVIENNFTYKHMNKAKILMESCGIQFTEEEEKRWYNFIHQIENN